MIDFIISYLVEGEALSVGQRLQLVERHRVCPGECELLLVFVSAWGETAMHINITNRPY